MGFWGVVVESGKTEVVEHHGSFLHVAQVCLGEIKKGEGIEPVILTAKVDGQKFVVGRLSERVPQLLVDLVFENSFELSHNWKNGSVHFTGYIVENCNSESGSDSEDENVTIPIDLGVVSGNLNLQPEKEKNVTNSNKILKSGQIVSSGPSGEEEKDSSADDDSDNDDEEQVNEDDKSNEDEDEESEDSEEESEEKKVDIGKKRPAEAVTPAADKKAKFVTPEKTGSKSGGSKVGSHVPTPHPAKQAKKIAAISGKAFPCSQCSRSFGSDIAVQSHTKAKHAPAK